MGISSHRAPCGGGFAQFPNLLLFFGVLYPNAYSIALLPGIIACAVLIFRRANEPTITWRLALLALVGSAPGLALSHPSSAIAFIVLAAPLAVAAAMSWLKWVRREKPRPVTITVQVTIGVVVLVVSVLAFIFARPAREAAFWTPTLSWGQGIESIVLSSEAFSAPTIPLSILLCVGVIALIVTKTQRWLVPSLGIILGLYLASVSLWVGTSRYLLTGTWYSDKYRLIALLPVVMLPIASFGIYWLGVQLARLVLVRSGTMPAPSDEQRKQIHAVVGIALAAVFAVLLQSGPALAASSASLTARYSTTDDSPLLSTDERALLERLDSIVPEAAMVSGSPWTGASLVYAFADRRALTPHIYGDRTPADVAILDGLRDAKPGSAACDAVEELTAYFVLDFGEREVHGGSNTPAGFVDLAQSDAVLLRDSEGEARLYEVVGCTP